MTTAIVPEVGEAIAATIADTDYGLSLPARFSYADWNLELGTTADQSIRIDVVPVLSGYKAEWGTVSKFDHTVAFDIALRKKFGTDDREEIENKSVIKNSSMNEVLLVWQKVFEFWHPQQPESGDTPLIDVPDCQWISTEPTAIWLKKHLNEFGQYTGLIRLKFMVSRGKAT